MRRAIAVLVALACAGCGSADDDPQPLARSGSPAYEGPLKARAAVDALQCDGATPYEHSRGQYDAGPEMVQPTAAGAFHDFVAQRGLGWETPREGYRLEREEPGRVLISYAVGNRTKVAVVVADDINGAEGDRGWGVLAWAQCDPSELPAAVTDALDVGVWEDRAGNRLPVTRVRSFPGAEHCQWTEVTFLLIGPDERRADWYVRNAPPDLWEYLRGSFEPAATLPPGATDTGWRRGGRELWLGPGNAAAYLVSADDPQDAERWPAAKEPIWCA